MQFVDLRGGEAFAAADGRDHQVQRGVLRVSALLDEVLRRLVGNANLYELLVLRVVLAEVGAQAALTVVYLKHFLLLSVVLEEQ
jgi:hypothetical protein